MSKLVLGTAQFGMDYGINNTRGKVPQTEVFEILEKALESGIDMLDVAYDYGDSERIIGQFLQKNKSNFKIVSKLPPDNSENTEKFLYESLEKLNSGRIYGYLVHDFKSFLEKAEIWNILKQLKAQNKVEKIGFSLYHPKEIEYLLEKNIQLDIVQVPFSIFDQRFSKIFPLLKEKGVEIHVRSIFLQGLVFKNPDGLKGNFGKSKDKLLFLRSLSKEINIPFPAIFINFAILNNFIDKVIIGIDSIENLRENIGSLSHQARIKDIYNKLLSLKEDDENIILPINWGNSNN